MGAFSGWHWLIVAVLVFLLFGRGKISEVMGDFAKGIKSFKKGLNEDEDEAPRPLPKEEAKKDSSDSSKL